MKKFELNEEELDLLIRFCDFAQDEYWYELDSPEYLIGEKLREVKEQLQREEEEES